MFQNRHKITGNPCKSDSSLKPIACAGNIKGKTTNLKSRGVVYKKSTKPLACAGTSKRVSNNLKPKGNVNKPCTPPPKPTDSTPTKGMPKDAQKSFRSNLRSLGGGAKCHS